MKVRGGGREIQCSLLDHGFFWFWIPHCVSHAVVDGCRRLLDTRKVVHEFRSLITSNTNNCALAFQ
jgi:hypothetical protein